MAAGRVDAEQARVLAAVKESVAEFKKRNQYKVKGEDGKEVLKSHEPTFGWVEAAVKEENPALLDALVADVYEAVTKK